MKELTMSYIQHKQSNNSNPSKEFTAKHMLIIMLLFFGVIISVNLTMAMLASGSWTGLVVKNSYVASQNFNKTLEQAQRQVNLGWTAQISQKNGLLTFIINDKSGEPIKDLKVTAYIGRPTHEQEDKKITLTTVGNKSFASPSQLEPGYWSIKIIASTPSGVVFRQDSKLYVKGEK